MIFQSESLSTLERIPIVDYAFLRRWQQNVDVFEYIPNNFGGTLTQLLKISSPENKTYFFAILRDVLN